MRTLTILRHIIIIPILVIIEMSVYIFGDKNVDLSVFVKYYVYDILYFYVVAYCILPIVFQKFQGFIFRIVIAGVLIVAYGLLLVVLESLFKYFDSGKWECYLTFQLVHRSSARGLLLTIFAYMFFNGKYQLMMEKENSNREKRSIELENDLLRAQVDPHLINNVLSVLYERIENYSKEDAEIISLLSAMTSNAISQSDNNGHVSLQQEIDNIKNYIRINELCRERELPIDFEILLKDNISWIIPPNLLLESIANMLKHGDLTDPHSGTISLDATSDTFMIFKTFNHTFAERRSIGHNIGLKNLEGRLITNYPNAYKLYVEETFNSFSLTLILYR